MAGQDLLALGQPPLAPGVCVETGPVLVAFVLDRRTDVELLLASALFENLCAAVGLVVLLRAPATVGVDEGQVVLG